MRRSRRLLLALALLSPLLAAAQPYTAIPGTTLRFASVDEGRRVLGAEDDWTRATSDFQRRAVTGRPGPVDGADFRTQQAAAVVAWQPAQEARWRRALDALAPALKAMPLPLPREVLLINTDGSDAANAPYTRAAAVILPSATLAQQDHSDAELLAHELAHVMSRHRPELATRLYAAIGFEPAPELRWPAEWLPLRIANPDAPQHRHLMRTTIGGRPVALMPVLVARRSELRPGETFFDLMDLRLLEVEAAGGTTQPVRRDGRPAWHGPGDARDYLVRLGGNTGYIIHPEETVADNIAFLLSGRQVRNPALLKRIAAVLAEER